MWIGVDGWVGMFEHLRSTMVVGDVCVLAFGNTYVCSNA